MAGIDWYEAGLQAGRSIAEAGGSAANVEIDPIGFDLGRSWLDGVLDTLLEKGLDAKMIRSRRNCWLPSRAPTRGRRTAPIEALI